MEDTNSAIGADGIPELYRRAVQEFAAELDLDADALVRGEQLNLGGMGFWLQHYGHLDPRGITIMADLGELPLGPALQLQLYRQLLENNVTTPAGLSGSYGILPETSNCVLTMRLALDQVESAGNRLGQVLTALLQGFNDMHQLMLTAVDDMAKQSADGELVAV